MPWPVGQKPPVYNFPIPVFNVVPRAATKGRFCPAGTRELLEGDGGRKEGRSKRSSPGGISIHSCSLRDSSFMLFIISLSFPFFNIWFPCFQPPSPRVFRTICPFYWGFFFRVVQAGASSPARSPAPAPRSPSTGLRGGRALGALPALLLRVPPRSGGGSCCRDGSAEHPQDGVPRAEGVHP